MHYQYKQINNFHMKKKSAVEEKMRKLEKLSKKSLSQIRGGSDGNFTKQPKSGAVIYF